MHGCVDKLFYLATKIQDRQQLVQCSCGLHMRPGARSLHRKTIRIERNIETQGSERVQPSVFTVSPRDWCVDVRVCAVYVCVSGVCVVCVCL